MKTILTSLLLLICCTICNAQYLEESNKKQDTTDTDPVFAWFEQREKPHLNSKILEFESKMLAENLRKEQVANDKKGRMPVYPVPNSENYPMPIQSVDSTKTKYLKIFPATED